VTGRLFSPCPPVSSTNKSDRHDIAEIVLKVALNTINQTNNTHEYNKTMILKNYLNDYYLIVERTQRTPPLWW
jgi:hypothetical protein